MRVKEHLFQWLIGATLMLVLSMSLSRVAGAAGPEGQGPDTLQVEGVSSTLLECLTVGPDLQGQTSGVVHLTWQGQVEGARLTLGLAGSAAAHQVKVNGQVVGQVPVYPGGAPCSDEESIALEVPPGLLNQGDNHIEITDSGLAGDSWTAAYVRLNVRGELVINTSGSSGELGPAGNVSAFATVFQDSFTSSYDSSLQTFEVQEPAGYNPGTPTPLLIAVHPRGGKKDFGVTRFGPEIDAKGWLVASPEMHGHWPIPDECKTYPNSCDYEDQVLAGTTSASATPRPGAHANASLESQYDTADTVQYMIDHYNVDPNRIYLVGYSMGSMGGIITGAKYPHLFAAIYANKGPTDMDEWYYEQASFYGTHNNDILRAMRKECYVVSGGNTPAYPAAGPGSPANPFCYLRRSGIEYARNFIHVPIYLIHSQADNLVPSHHSTDLAAAINSFGPDQAVSAVLDTTVGPTCPPDSKGRYPYHCFEPDPNDVLAYLEQYTLDNTHHHINIATDESKVFYWLKVERLGGGDRITQIEATYYPATKCILVNIADSGQLRLGFNLGTSQQLTDIVPLPSLGLPENINYTVQETGQAAYNEYYSSGYFNVDLNNSGNYSVIITANSQVASCEVKVYLPTLFKK